MEITDSESCPSYAKGPPWLFKGSALYQLHLVKADTARPFIPKEFKLVEAFGYTLGGFFLARYDDSPAGRFDELVVIAGIVWNPPTSCAWAARVLVNSREACIHGRKDIGLPSHVAKFSKRLVPISRMQRNKGLDFLNRIGLDAAFSGREDNGIEIQVNEMEESTATAVCNINLPSAQPGSKSDKKHFWPVIRMSLPSFSGQTDYNPHLLKYSCQIECRVRAVEPAKISKLNTASINDRDGSSEDSSFTSEHSTEGVFSERDAFDRSVSVLLSKPILALEFNSLRMQVEAPTVVTLQSRSRTS